MTVRNKIYLIGLALLVLTACTTSMNDEDMNLDDNSVGKELTEEELGSDVNQAETEFNEADTAAVADQGVNPDLAEDVLNEDLDGGMQTSTKAAPAPAPAPPPAAAPTPEAEVAHQNPEPPPASEMGQQIDITNIRYLADQGGRVQIDTSAPATYRTREVSNQNQLVIEIANARLPSKLMRPFITKDFKQSIASINAYQDSGSTTARVVVQFREPTTADVAQDGSRLTLVASGSSSMGGGSDSVVDNDGVGSSSQSASDRVSKASKAIDNFDDERFYGKPINLEVRETNVRDVFTLIAEQSGANIVVSDDVKGNVTIKLRQIPWDQALSIIMKSKNLGYVKQGNVLRIAPVDQLQKENDDIRKIQDAQKLALPLRVKVIPVNYAKVSDLATQLKDFLSPRGKVQPDARTSALIVTDITENLDRATNLIKALDVPPQQVLIEGKIVEATEDLTRILGVTWGLSGETLYKSGAGINPNLNVNPGLMGSNLAMNIGVGTMKYLGTLDATLGLAESRSQAKVLSSPRVVTLNNEPASIKQTTQVPIPKQTAIQGAGTTTSTDYKPVELSLDVTPQITANTDVLLQIALKREFTTASANADTGPGIESREAKTKVLVGSGQTAVIGGIYQNDELNAQAGVPYVQDVPVVGWLFKGKKTASTKRELLLFLTPRILSRNKTPANGTEL